MTKDIILAISIVLGILCGMWLMYKFGQNHKK